MEHRRTFAALGICAVAVITASGGFHFESDEIRTVVSLTPASVAAWPLVVGSIVAAIRAPSQRSADHAAWWRRTGAFIADFATLTSVVGIPLCLLALLLESGTLPPPWEFERHGSRAADTFVTLFFFPSFVALWAGLGLAFHPRLSSPGALVFDVKLDAGDAVPTWRIATFGIFAYYGIVVPPFRAFAIGMEPQAWRRAA